MTRSDEPHPSQATAGTPRALAGVRVIELGEGKALAVAGKLLRELGAEVIKVEPPEGDALRRYGPFPADVPHEEQSGIFIWLNGGKRGLRLDLRTSSGRDSPVEQLAEQLAAPLAELLAGADVLLHSLRPRDAASLGLQSGALHARWPRLIVTAITTFGSSGPYADWRGYPIQAYAGSSVMYRIGELGRPPLTQPLDGAAVHHAGPQAAAATALALLHRDRTGHGQFVDLSALEAVTISVWGHGIGGIVYAGQPPGHRTGRYYTPGRPWGLWETADGDFAMITLIEHHWHTFLEALGNPEWAQDPLIRNLGNPAFMRALTPEQGEQVVALLEEHAGRWYREQTTADVWETMRRLRLPFLPVHSVPQVCDSDHATARGLLVEAPGAHPPLRLPRAPYLLSRTPALGPAPPPTPGGPPATRWESVPAPEPPPDSSPPEAPLSGLRVLDLGQVWAGPLLGRYLADYGADVVQIRPGNRPPTTPGSTDPADPLAWEWIYRNKRSLALDLKRPEGAALFRRLAAACDVVIDNFAPRVMPSLGLDYEDLIEENERLIMIALPASGRTGPWSDLLSYGPTLEALYGMKSLNGYPELGQIMEQQSELDPISVSYAILALFAALRHRNRSGRGQLIELAQGEACFAGLGEAVIEHVWNGRELGPLGNTHRTLAPHGAYPCAGDDQWIAIACGSDEEWAALARSAGHGEWLQDARFEGAAQRRAARSALDTAIGEWTAGHDKQRLAAQLQAAGVAAFPVLDALEVVSDPHHSERRRHFALHEDLTADALLNGNAWHLSAAPPRLRRPAPAHGAHNADVLRDYLGMSEPDVRQLEEAGVLA